MDIDCQFYPKLVQSLRKEVLEFSTFFEAFHWLDCHRFINNQNVVNDLMEFKNKLNPKLKLRIHSTSEMYGNKSMFRLHVKPECDLFISFLEKVEPNNYHMHYFNCKKSMEIHFKIITKFEDF
jgi:hypothetical protein